MAHHQAGWIVRERHPCAAGSPGEPKGIADKIRSAMSARWCRLSHMAKGDKPECAKKLDAFELCARERLASVLGPMERLDRGGGPEGLPDFRVHLPDGAWRSSRLPA